MIRSGPRVGNCAGKGSKHGQVGGRDAMDDGPIDVLILVTCDGAKPHCLRQAGCQLLREDAVVGQDGKCFAHRLWRRPTPMRDQVAADVHGYLDGALQVHR